jgi:putative endonuclease
LVQGGAALAQETGVSDERIALGKSGEDLACLELERRGYVILVRRYRRRGGELDIIARDGETTVFVEVKTRQGHRFGDAAQAVHGLKRRRMTQLALDYLMRHRLADRPCRFDVVSIHMDQGRPVIEVFQNAFDAFS